MLGLWCKDVPLASSGVFIEGAKRMSRSKEFETMADTLRQRAAVENKRHILLFYYLLNHDVKINGCGDLGRGTQTTRGTDRHRGNSHRHRKTLTITNTLLQRQRKTFWPGQAIKGQIGGQLRNGQTHPSLKKLAQLVCASPTPPGEFQSQSSFSCPRIIFNNA